MTPLARSKTKPNPSVVSASWEFSAIGTAWWIGLFEPINQKQLSELMRQVAARIERFDATYSRFREDSLITQISRTAGSYSFPGDSKALFALYKQLYTATDGAVTPLIGDVLVAAGYDANYGFTPQPLTTPPAWDEVLENHGAMLTVKRPVTLDFGAAGKGYLIDLIATLLRNMGISRFCVDAGGDVLVRDEQPYRVGLEHPDNPQQVIGVAELQDSAIAGSAGNRRRWAGYHHIMDPTLLRSVESIIAVWVVAESGILADGLATALFFVPPARLMQFTFEYLIINDRNQYKCSPGFPAELF